MRIFLILSSIAMGTLSGTAVAQDADPISIGTVIGSGDNQAINGWENVGGALYQSRTFANYITTERSECCVATFQKGDSFILAATVALARNSTGGVIAERVVGTFRTDQEADEIQADCTLLWIAPAISFVNERTRMVRSIVYDGAGFRTVNWMDTEGDCFTGD